MTTTDPSNIDLGPTATRLETLTDGIYAIAMTLLVLDIHFPHVSAPTPSSLYTQIVQQFPNLIHYALSFIILASFWMAHHVQFYYIKRVNRKLLWINIFGLMFVALLPFSTSLIADYGNFELAADFFHFNMFFLGASYYINWTYATRNHHFVDRNLSNKTIESAKKKILVITLFPLLAILLAFFSPRWSSLPYMIIPFMLVMKKK